MAQVHKILVEIDPRMPVQEICSIISAIAAFHPNAEADILHGVQKAIDERLNVLKQDKPE